MSNVDDFQVPDDHNLFIRMMESLHNADPMYRPTNYWASYEQRFLPELLNIGLRDFRSRHGSVLGSFGATDLFFQGLDPENVEVTHWYYCYAKKKIEAAGLTMRSLGTSRFGTPEDLVEIDGQLWSTQHLTYCVMLADAYPHIHFNPIGVYCELGPGLGRSVEILSRLYENMTFLLFDIPPQLYVANQYLKKVLGMRVVPYDEALKFSPDNDGNVPAAVAGKILILPTWRMPAWANCKTNVFWNSASFQEMEPDVVLNYLELVKHMAPEWVYINALPGGNFWGEWHPGQGGTKQPVLDKYYFQGLGELYKLSALYDTDYLLRAPRYKSYVFALQEWK